MSGYTDSELRNLVQVLEKQDPTLISSVRNAFREKTFSYGTSGKQGGGLKLGGIMAKSINDAAKEGGGKFSSGTDSKGYAFQTGVRQMAQRAGNYQMMDMYYGDGGDIIQRVDPNILRFVMYAAKLLPWPGPGQYVDPWPVPSGTVLAQHPYFAFPQRGVAIAWKEDPVTTRVYGDDGWGHPLTGTKELSRIIRWCVGEFGGTITFEGSELYYNQVFKNGGRFSDTDLEARSFFKFFSKGLSRTIFGKGPGTVVFHWRGVETVPSKLLFLTSWEFSPFAADQWYKIVHPENFAPQLKDQFKNPAFKVPASGAPKPKFGGSVYDTSGTSTPGDVIKTMGVSLNESQIDEMSKKLGIDHWDLWNKFLALPPGLGPWAVGKWLKQLLAA